MTSVHLRPAAPHVSAIAVGLVAALIAADLATGSVVAQGRMDLALAGVGIAALTLSFLFWRPAVYAVFVLLCVEGFLRNAVDTPTVLLVKDLLLAGIYLRVFGGKLQRQAAASASGPLKVPLLVFAAVVLVQTLNPNVTSVGQALVGVRTWLYYVPLYYVARDMIRSDQDLRRFGLFILGCASVVSVVGLLQYVSGPALYAALGKAFANAVFVTQGQNASIYRPNSTFAFPSDFAMFAGIATLLAIGFMFGRTGRARIVSSAVVVLLVATDIAENQRTLFVLLPPLILLVFALRRTVRPAIVMALALLLGVLVVGMIGSGSAFDRINELLQNQNGVFGTRAGAYFDGFLAALQSPIGFGAGATSIGSRYVVGNIPLFVEFSLAKVVGDLSLVGLAAYFWVFVVLLRDTLSVHRRASRNGLTQVAGAAAAVFAIQLLIAYSGYDLAVEALLFWFLSGAVSSLGESMVETGPGAVSVGRQWRRPEIAARPRAPGSVEA